MISGYIDTLKLMLSDDYEISDSEYVALSDILIKSELSEIAFESGLVQIICILIKNHIKLPVSLNYLKEEWQKKNKAFNFVQMLSILINKKVLTIRKVKKEVYRNDTSITKTVTDLENNMDIVVVVYGSKTFNEIFNVFMNILSGKDTKTANTDMYEIAESVIAFNMANKYKDFVSKLKRDLKNGFNIDVVLESAEIDDVLKTMELGININDTSPYNCANKDILRLAKKHIKDIGVKNIINVYMDSASSLYLDIALDITNKNYSQVANKVYDFIEDLEVNYVS